MDPDRTYGYRGLGKMLDWDHNKYEMWHSNDTVYYGMRRYDTGKKHGIVREITNNGTIRESTWDYMGDKEGISREIFSNSTARVTIWRWFNLRQHSYVVA